MINVPALLIKHVFSWLYRIFGELSFQCGLPNGYFIFFIPHLPLGGQYITHEAQAQAKKTIIPQMSPVWV